MQTIKNELQLKTAKYLFIGISLTIILAFVVLLIINLGASDIAILDVIRIVLYKMFALALPESIKANSVAIVWDIRLPRILNSIFVGAGLAVSGAVFQSLLMNPLADPYTIGVSTGAAFGASLAILLNILFAMALPVVLFAFISALLTLLLVIMIANRSGVMTSSNLIIAVLLSVPLCLLGLAL